MAEKMSAVELRTKILIAKEALEANKEPKYKTSGIYTTSHGISTNIKTAGEAAVVGVCSSLMNRKAANEFLGLDTTVGGFKTSEWLNDCRERISQLERTRNIQKLTATEEKVRQQLGADELKEIEIDAALASVAGLI
jgi:hypothetical protein